ncbi:universal stress protein [Planctomonas psychrotolerans]|uniref:universal stress protein n=1 Tax=Planctomonas psychrotolerans TaxID=2528712 RepID=UPI00123B3BD8|nr:universal stress protein [Planctomonas psychrotolerans]
MILVGVDGSAPGRVALRWSVDRAARTREELTLAHVLDDEWGMVSARLLQELRADAQALLARELTYVRTLNPVVSAHTVLLEGSPMWRLVEESAEASLVAVGTHKTGFVRGRVIGSRSLALAGASPVPVVVVPESWNRARSGIVVGVDRSSAGRAALRFAADEAARAGSELTLVRAWSTRSFLRTEYDSDELENELVQPELDAVFSEAAAIVEQHRAGTPVRTRRVRRDTSEVLIDVTATAELLVLGSSRRDASPTTLGSVTHDVLLNLAGPVAVVHADRPAPEAAP